MPGISTIFQETGCPLGPSGSPVLIAVVLSLGICRVVCLSYSALVMHASVALETHVG